MTDRRTVRPREGLLIRDPFTKHRIPPEGCQVVTTGNYGTIIQRHINAGDLVELTDEPKNALREAGVDQRKAEGVEREARSASKKGEV